ncbi:MAG: iron-sulfur cluster assembly scaffold protein [Candidatus Hermodarchaeota archaeon]
MPKDNLNKYVEDLQKMIYDEEMKMYNERIIELYHEPKNWGRPPDEEITVSKTYEGSCGDTMVIFLKIEDNIITKAHFLTDGCGASVATGCQTTLLIENTSVEDAEKVTAEDIDNALNRLPEDHKHCAELAFRTLQRALDDYHIAKSVKK